ncbi:unnamed protein product [Chrysoparadoxa australica]
MVVVPHFFFLLLALLSSACSAASLDECQSLYGAYEAFDGPNWSTSDNWPSARELVDDSCCMWMGVTCSETILWKVDLRSNQLSGPIPEGLFSDLKELTSVYLYNNQLSGPLPERLFDGLTKMIDVELTNNQLSGPLPERLFGNLMELSIVSATLRLPPFSSLSVYLPPSTRCGYEQISCLDHSQKASLIT